MENDPAFPCHDDGHHETRTGISKREYFAAKAMAAIIIANPLYKTPERNVSNSSRDIAHRAYEMADAMLDRRSKQED